MSDTAGVDDPAELQLDVVGAEVVEETAALTEQDRDLVNLQLVEDAGGGSELRGPGAVHKDVLAAGSILGRSHRGFDVGYVGARRPPYGVSPGLVARQDEDRHAMVIAAPAIDEVEGPPADDYRAGGQELVEDLTAGT